MDGSSDHFLADRTAEQREQISFAFQTTHGEPGQGKNFFGRRKKRGPSFTKLPFSIT